jgi:hypothetical protein
MGVFSCFDRDSLFSFLEETDEFIVGRIHTLDDHFGFPDEWHKIRIARPSGNHMEVIMVDNTRARTPPYVHACVESMGAIVLSQYFQTEFKQVRHFICRRFVSFLHGIEVFIGSDHQVSGSVGVSVQDDKIVLSPEKDMCFPVLLGIDGEAEDAFGCL